MKNMKVSIKLTVSFLIVIALTVVVGISGIVGMIQIHSGSTEMYEQQAHPLADLAFARENFQQLRVNLRDVVLNSGNTAKLDVIEYRVESSKLEFTRFIGEYSETLHDPDLIELYDQIMEAFDDFQIYMPEIMQSARVGAPPMQMLLMMENMVEPTDFIESALEHLAVVRVDESSIVHNINTFWFNLQFSLIIGITTLAILVAFFLVRYITSLIAKPLKDIGNFATEVSSGNIGIADVKKHSICVSSNDELGALARILENSYMQLNEYERSKFEAESASQAKSEFLSKMSHEIRTPMNAVLGMTELILRENISDAIREQAVTIKHSGNHLLSIINDILDFSKIESGKMEIHENEYLFHSIVQDVVNIIKMRMNNPDLRFYVYMQHDIPNTLVGDEVRIKQVLINLLSNAYKYTQKGYFALDVTGEKTDDETFTLTMAIKDTGIGIKPEDVEVLFDEFTRFEMDTHRNIEGTGIGLAITYSLVKLMNGKIEVKSEYKQGSEFIISLPQKIGDHDYETPQFEKLKILLHCRTPLNTGYISRSLADLGAEYHIISQDNEMERKLASGDWDYIFAEAELAYAALRVAEVLKHPAKVVMLIDSYDSTYAARDGYDLATLIMPAYLLSIANILGGGNTEYSDNNNQIEHFIAPEAKVLVVDDIDTNLKVAEGLLKQYSVNVNLCTSGKDAIKAVKTEDYDIVFMDHMMPGMDGIETTRRIRDLAGLGQKYAHLPIVALTANALVGSREMFLENDFNDFVSKPIDIVKLNNTLIRWLPKEKVQYVDPPEPGAETAEQKVNIEIEGVDTVKGMALTGGDVQSYMYILQVFHRDGVKKMQELGECLESGDISLYTIHVHALSTACANIGASEISKEAKTLEAAGKKDDTKFIKANHDDFAVRCKKLLDSIGAVLSAGAENSEAVDMDALISLLSELKTGLENYNVGEIRKAVKVLKGYAGYPEIGEPLADILKNILMSEYEDAVVQVDEFLEKHG